MNSGRMIYVPKIVLIEVDDIIREDRLRQRKADGFRMLVKYARVGRELQRIRTLDFSRSIKLPRI